MPWRITRRDTPVALATADTPRGPNAELSAATNKRRARSSSKGLRASKRSLIPGSAFTYSSVRQHILI